MRRGALLAIAAVAAAWTATATAQENDPRANPFTPPPTADEEQARQDERTRNIVWQLHPEMKALVMQDVNASQAALEIKIRRRIDQAIQEASTPAPGQQGSILGGIAEAVAPEPKIPEGAKFISCVNGKAVYRDKDNTIFQVDGTGGDSCAN